MRSTPGAATSTQVPLSENVAGCPERSTAATVSTPVTSAGVALVRGRCPDRFCALQPVAGSTLPAAAMTTASLLSAASTASCTATAPASGGALTLRQLAAEMLMIFAPAYTAYLMASASDAVVPATVSAEPGWASLT